jgi:hypothetical protein
VSVDGTQRLAPGVALVDVPDGSARLLDLDGNFHALSPLGAAMLRLALERGPEEAVRVIAADYAQDEGRVRADLGRFLGSLGRLGLLGRGRRRRVRGALGWLALPAALALAWRWPRRAGALLGLARLSFRLFGWAATLRVWRWYHRGATRPLSPGEASKAARAVDEEVRASAGGHLLAVECKERALAAWALARAAGLPAELVVGVTFFPLAGHCWCELAGEPLGDEPARCALYAPVFRYS